MPCFGVKVDFRSIQGIVRAFSKRLGPFPVICFSQIRRRILSLPVSFRRRVGEMIVSCDGSGMKAKGYGYRWPASEGIFSAMKRMYGEGIRSYRIRNMYHKAKLKFWAYQKLRDIA
ncbi:MAG: hypothetical protein QXL17_06715 [Candidatus Thermoplasmatota archaeon]